MFSPLSRRGLCLLYLTLCGNACVNAARPPSELNQQTEDADGSQTPSADPSSGSPDGSDEAPVTQTGSGSTGSGNTGRESGFVSVAPGGGGAFTLIAFHPDDPDFSMVGTNVGGLIRSTDGGKTYQSVTNGIQARLITDVKFAKVRGKVHALVATPMGLYVSDDTNGKATLGDSWKLTEGLEDGYGLIDFYHPVLALGVDPKDNDTVWVGIGLMGAEDMAAFEVGSKRCDPYSVYKYSVSSGVFSPVLSLRPELIGLSRDEIKTECASVETETPATVGPAIFNIKVHPEDSKTVFFSGDSGLLATYDGGGTIYEVGISNPRKTSDKGVSYTRCGTTGCDVTNAIGESVTFTNRSCTREAKSSGCLPVETDMGETHAILKSTDIVVSEGKTLIYAVVYDTGYAAVDPDAGYLCDGDDEYVQDTAFKEFRGGPWVSDDLGKTWDYFYKAKDNDSSVIGNWIRCGADGPEAHTTWYSTVNVDPNDPNHVILGTMRGAGSSPGAWEHRKFSGDVYEWKNITSTHEGSSTISTGMCFLANAEDGLNLKYDNCYEGDRTDDLFRDGSNVSLGTLGLVSVRDWGSEDTLEIYLPTSRGMLKGTWRGANQWSDATGRYYFDHLHTDPVSSDGARDYWTGSALNDFCPSGGVAFLNSAGTKFLMAGKDAGLLKTVDGGASWKLIRDNENYRTDWSLPDDFKFDDMDPPLVQDEKDGVIYGANQDTARADEANSVVMSKDGGETWSVVGGHCYPGSSTLASCDDATGDNGMARSAIVYDLALDYSRESRLRVLASTNEGIYVYDPKLTAGSQWTRLDDSGCLASDGTNTVTSSDLWTDPSLPSVILGTIEYEAGDGSSSVAYDGVYLIKPDSSSCQRLGDAASPLKGPQAVTMTEKDGVYRIVAAAVSHSYPILAQTTATVTAGSLTATGNWETALDFHYIYEGDVSEAAKAWDSYLDNHESWRAEFEHEYFKRKYFAVLATAPGKPNVVLAALNSAPLYDYNSSGHVYSSGDGGVSWGVAEEFEDLPVKAMAKIQFSPDAEKIFFSTACSSLFVGCSPYADGESCTLP